MADNRTDLFQYLSRREAALHEDLCKWSAKFTKDPCWALEWGQDAFVNAARHKVCKLTLTTLAEGIPLDKLEQELRQRVLRGAKSPTRSTSPAHCVIEQELLSAYADMLEIVASYNASDLKSDTV